MKITMHEMEHCPNCKIVEKIIQRELGDDIEIEHKLMDNESINKFVELGLGSSPVIECEDKFYSASSKRERDELVETLKIIRDHTNA